MEQEYKTSMSFTLLYGAIAAACTILSFYIYSGALKTAINKDYYNYQYTNNSHYGLLIIPVIGLAATILITINLIKRKVILSTNIVSYKSIWGYREIPTNEIKGFRIRDKAIVVAPIEPTSSKIIIRDYVSVSDNKGITKWLSDNFKNLDAIELETAKDQLLQNSAYGVTKEEREANFNYYRRYNMIYSFTGIGIFFISIVLSIFNIYLSIIFFLYPLAGIMLTLRSKGMIRLFTKRNSPYFPVFYGLFFSSLGPVLQSIIGIKIITYHNLWQPILIFAVLLIIFLFYVFVIKPKDSVLTQIFFVLVISFVYAFGTILMINCSFDYSKAQVYTAIIKNKYINHGKSTSYHLELSDCGGFKGEEPIVVSRSYYNQASVGSAIKIDMKRGVFDAPWFRIDGY